MIYLKMHKGLKISLSLATKRRGYRPEAVYDEAKDAIVILNANANIIGTINHEFMHKILYKNKLKKPATYGTAN